jgi:hypothetical protein
VTAAQQRRRVIEAAEAFFKKDCWWGEVACTLSIRITEVGKHRIRYRIDPDASPNLASLQSWGNRVSFAAKCRLEYAQDIHKEYTGGGARVDDDKKNEANKFTSRADEVFRGANEAIAALQPDGMDINLLGLDPPEGADINDVLIHAFNELTITRLPQENKLWKNLLDALATDTTRL